jgi:hypothetical protein
MNNTVVITRHKALVQYLLEIGLITEDTPVLPHVSSEGEIRGMVVIGPCPLRLAAAASAWIDIPMSIPKDIRGQELTLEQVRQFAGEPIEYNIRESKDGYLDFLERKRAHQRLAESLGFPGVGELELLRATNKQWASQHGLVSSIDSEPGIVTRDMVADLVALQDIPAAPFEDITRRWVFINGGVATLRTMTSYCRSTSSECWVRAT